ncbi:hypothetical protein ACJRO7_011363 [Eucalyptus globulus]|uniref:F-box domain-containing protein n=1 Tax=Eucalyptus globulus TaxID=34317 RepID=A0ABD3LKE4_EUCGL
MDELPRAILSEILSRVSGPSLLRHRRVCRRWREAIDDPYFRNSLHRSKEGVVLYLEHGKDEEIRILTMHQEAAATWMVEMGKLPTPRGYVIRGACNGLLFFMHRTDVRNNGELLMNPLTKRILILRRAPDLSPDRSVYGLGLDRSTNTYKMVQIEKTGSDEKTRTGTAVARIYDFDKRSWRAGEAPPLPTGAGLSRDFVFSSGALNWFLKRRLPLSPLTGAMLSFDLTKEEFSLIPIPDVFFKGGSGDFPI